MLLQLYWNENIMDWNEKYTNIPGIFPQCPISNFQSKYYQFPTYHLQKLMYMRPKVNIKGTIW